MRTCRILGFFVLMAAVPATARAAAVDDRPDEHDDRIVRTWITDSGHEITITEVLDYTPRRQGRGGDAQGCCKPRIDKRSTYYLADGTLHAEADVYPDREQVFILFDKDKSELFRHTLIVSGRRVVVEVAGVSCDDAPHRVRFWCTEYRQCHKTKGVRGECS